MVPDAMIFVFWMLSFKPTFSLNVIYLINKLKNKNHMITSIDAENPLEKLKMYLWLKTLNKMDIEGTYFNIIKAIYHTPIADIILKG